MPVKPKADVEAGGFVESIVGSEIIGWSANPAAPRYADKLHLIIGSSTFEVETRIERQDVAAEGYEDNLCGFLFDLSKLPIEDLEAIRSSVAPGTASFEISARSSESGSALGILCAGVSAVLVERLIQEHGAKDYFSTVGEIDGLRQGSISGWCVFPTASEMPRVILKVDGVVACSAACTGIRTDVEKIYGKVYAGFELPLPFSAFDARPHLIEVSEAISGYVFKPFRLVGPPLEQIHEFSSPAAELQKFLVAGQTLLDRIKNQPVPSIPFGAGWHDLFVNEYRTGAIALDRQREDQRLLSYRPKFSIVCPVWNTDISHLAEAIGSVTSQTYDNWELIISDDHSSNTDVAHVLETWRERFPDRIVVLYAGENAGISENTNRALERASGDFVVFFDHDDVLEPDALYALASVQQKSRYKLIYTDEDSLGTDGRLCWPHFKPSWDPILLAGLNYICHLVCVDRASAGRNLYLDSKFDGAQDKEFLLRFAEGLQDEDVLHIPRVLYHWRHHAASTSKDAGKTDKILERSASASASWAKSYFGRGANVTIAEPREMFGNIVQPGLPEMAPTVSVIIPTRDKTELLLPCITSILACGYPNLDIVVIDHESREPLSRHVLDMVSRTPACSVLPYAGAFNWSAMNNYAAGKAKGDLLLFLNNDTEMLGKTAIADLVGYACDAKIGAVGAKLVYANGRIQHGGVVIGPGGIAGHSFVGLPRDDLGYFGYLRFARSVSAVTGACLMVRAKAFREVGGFDQDTMRVGLSDIDFCLKLQARGLRNVFVSACEIMHLESVSRGSDLDGPNAARFEMESNALRAAHPKTIEADPFYNPAFESRSDPYRFIRVGPGPAYDCRQITL